MVSLASAGILLLSIAGVAMAVRRSATPPAHEAKGAAVVAVPVTALPIATTGTPSKLPPDASTDSPDTIVSPAPAETPVPKLKTVVKPHTKPAASTSGQHYTIEIGDTGYAPSVVKATAGSPITLTVGRGDGCAAGFTIPSLGIEKDNSKGPVTFSVGRLKPGTYRFACAMDMVEGALVVR